MLKSLFYGVVRIVETILFYIFREYNWLGCSVFIYPITPFEYPITFITLHYVEIVLN